MAYRKATMIELKEILIRIAEGQTKREVRKVMKIHGVTLNKYLGIVEDLGIDITSCKKEDITDSLVEKVRAKIGITKKRLEISPRDKILLPVKDKIEGHLKKGVPGTKIVRILSREGIKVDQSAFYRFVGEHLSSYKKSNITVRLPETEPGKYAQIDFGCLGKIWDPNTRKKRLARAFIVTLVYSRHMYVYITFSQNSDALISGCEAAWTYFGGIPLIVIVDNMGPAIDKADKYNPKINNLFLEYSQYRDFVIDPTNIAHPKGKPHVERMVPYVRGNFFSGEKFISIKDCQKSATDWCESIAGLRLHQGTRKVPKEVFENIERTALTPYDGIRYDIPYWSVCKVHPDHHIHFRKALYSLPTKFIGKKVEVRGDSSLVRIYYGGKLIKTHPRVADGKRSTDFSDYPAQLTPYTLRNPSYQIHEGAKKHPLIGEYIKFMLDGPYPWHRLRSVQKLLRMADKYGPERTAAACKKAKAYSIYDIWRIENMLKNCVEGMDIAPKESDSLRVSSKFKRKGSYFKNYSNLERKN